VTSRVFSLFVAIVLLSASCLLLSASAQAGLLEDHFGVQPTLLDPNPYSSQWTESLVGAPFDLTSLKPTKHTDTVDFYVEDWYGEWHSDDWYHKPLREDPNGHGYFDPNDPSSYANGYPSGGEPYDVEALYFDNDADNLYIAVVTSFDPPPGHIEDGRGYNNLLVLDGDIALDFGLQTPHDDGFSYDFGVNLNHEERQADGSADPGGTTVGQDVYRTSNAAWYVPKQAGVVKNDKLSNFDPNYSGSTATYLGDGTVTYRLYDFGTDSNGDPLLENNYNTYVIEAILPRSFFASQIPGGLQKGQQIRIQWGASCKNDMGEVSGTLNATYDTPPTTPELTPFVLIIATLFIVFVVNYRRRRTMAPSGVS